jgi:hypothetical protein
MPLAMRSDSFLMAPGRRGMDRTTAAPPQASGKGLAGGYQFQQPGATCRHVCCRAWRQASQHEEGDSQAASRAFPRGGHPARPAPTGDVPEELGAALPTGLRVLIVRTLPPGLVPDRDRNKPTLLLAAQSLPDPSLAGVSALVRSFAWELARELGTTRLLKS